MTGLSAETQEALSAIDQIAPISESSNNRAPSFVAGIGTNMYLDQSTDPAKRQAAVTALADYWQSHRSKFVAVHPPGHTAAPIAAEDTDWATEFQRRAKTVALSDPLEAAFFGAPVSPNTKWLSHFGTQLYMSEGIRLGQPLDLSETNFRMPASTFAQIGPADFIADLLSRCEALQPLHGVSGLFAFFDYIHASSSSRFDVLPYLQRFPGLHFERPMQFMAILGFAEKDMTPLRLFSTNWLTILSDQMLDDAPEVRAALEDLPDSCVVHPYDGGCIVQAGPYPQLGDVNRGLTLDDYMAVSDALKPLRFDGYSWTGMLEVASSDSSVEETRKWVARFDAPQD